jgi:hypothetical protein
MRLLSITHRLTGPQLREFVELIQLQQPTPLRVLPTDVGLAALCTDVLRSRRGHGVFTLDAPVAEVAVPDN